MKLEPSKFLLYASLPSATSRLFDKQIARDDPFMGDINSLDRPYFRESIDQVEIEIDGDFYPSWFIIGFFNHWVELSGITVENLRNAIDPLCPDSYEHALIDPILGETYQIHLECFLFYFDTFEYSTMLPFIYMMTHGGMMKIEDFYTKAGLLIVKSYFATLPLEDGHRQYFRITHNQREIELVELVE